MTVSGVISLTVNIEVPAAPVEGTDAILLFRRCSIPYWAEINEWRCFLIANWCRWCYSGFPKASPVDSIVQFMTVLRCLRVGGPLNSQIFVVEKKSGNCCSFQTFAVVGRLHSPKLRSFTSEVTGWMWLSGHALVFFVHVRVTFQVIALTTAVCKGAWPKRRVRWCVC